jgi:hypothetical protein
MALCEITVYLKSALDRIQDRVRELGPYAEALRDGFATAASRIATTYLRAVIVL